MEVILDIVISVLKERDNKCIWYQLYQQTYNVAQDKIGYKDSYNAFKAQVRVVIDKGCKDGYFTIKKRCIYLTPDEGLMAIYLVMNNTCHFYTFPSYLEDKILPILKTVTKWEGDKLVLPPEKVDMLVDILHEDTQIVVFENELTLSQTSLLRYQGQSLSSKVNRIIKIEQPLQRYEKVTLIPAQLDHHNDIHYVTFDPMDALMPIINVSHESNDETTTTSDGEDGEDDVYIKGDIESQLFNSRDYICEI
jgi:hypothetical protein